MSFSGKEQPDRNTEVIVESAIVLGKKLAVDPNLRGEVFIEMVTDDFRTISHCLIKQNALDPHYFIRLVQEKCGPCVTQVLDEQKHLFKGLFAPQLNRDLYMTREKYQLL